MVTGSSPSVGSDAELRELAGKATPGPWDFEYSGQDDYEPGLYPNVLTRSHGDQVISFDQGMRSLNEASSSLRDDAAYIAAVSPDVVLGLLDRAYPSDANHSTCRVPGKPGTLHVVSWISED